MPTAMHPWMDPNDVQLWPHGTRVIYETFDRIFSCKGHGWANLQSQQINLPFAGDEEFARLHAAVRFLLPILPGLAASSPVVDGERNGILDNRLVVYRNNCARVPSVTGEVVPEPVGSVGEYHERVLEPIYADLAQLDPEGVLRNEWVNARGAIARFDRNAIEIRVLDVQETPAMDVAFAELIVEVLKLLCAEQWLDTGGMNRWRTAELGTLLSLAARHGEGAGIGNKHYLRAFGYRGSATELKGLWEHLIETAGKRGSLQAGTGRLLEHYLRHGTLATRIGRAVGLLPAHAKLTRVYEELCEALAEGRPFAPPAPKKEQP
jgi:gamma-glutamyl:cysteine ligase YbdK (ATP-grasp superfamily)